MPLTTVSCLVLASDTFATPIIPPKLRNMLESLDTSPVQLNETVESLLGAKPGLVSTSRKPCMQTLDTLVISLTDPPIPILFPIMLRIVPSGRSST